MFEDFVFNSRRTFGLFFAKLINSSNILYLFPQTSASDDWPVPI